MSLIKLVPVFFSIPKEKNGNKKRNTVTKPRTIYATVIGLIDNAKHPTHICTNFLQKTLQILGLS